MKGEPIPLGTIASIPLFLASPGSCDYIALGLVEVSHRLVLLF